MNKLKVLLLAGFVIPITSQAQSKVDTMAVIPGVTAHRGYSMAFPENTLAAFQGGIDAHADWVELDIYKTKDGQIIVSHDATTKRTGDKDLVIANSTLKGLSQVDIATEFRNKHGLTLAQCPGATYAFVKGCSGTDHEAKPNPFIYSAQGRLCSRGDSNR